MNIRTLENTKKGDSVMFTGGPNHPVLKDGEMYKVSAVGRTDVQLKTDTGFCAMSYKYII